MKHRHVIRICTLFVVAGILLAGCDKTGTSLSSEKSQSQPQPSASSAPVLVEPSQSEKEQESWNFPEAQPWTLGAALRDLGVDQSNGLTLNTWDATLPSHDRCLKPTDPVVQEALAALLALQVDRTKPGEATLEPYRMSMQVFAGVLPGHPELGTKALTLHLPVTESEEGVAFTITSLVNQQYYARFAPDPEGKLEWQKLGQREVYYPLRGYPAWEARYRKPLLDALAKQGSRGSLFEQCTQPLVVQSQNPKGKPKIMADLLVQMGLETLAFQGLSLYQKNPADAQESCWTWFGKSEIRESSPEQKVLLQKFLTLPVQVLEGEEVQQPWNEEGEAGVKPPFQSRLIFTSQSALPDLARNPLGWALLQRRDREKDEAFICLYTGIANGVSHPEIATPRPGETELDPVALERIPLSQIEGAQQGKVSYTRWKIAGLEAWLQSVSKHFESTGALRVEAEQSRQP